MVWQLIIFNDLAKILVVLILLATMPYLYKLMKKDGLPNWNLVLIAVALFAVSICFHILNKYVTNCICGVLEHPFMMLSGLSGFYALYLGRKIKPKK